MNESLPIAESTRLAVDTAPEPAPAQVGSEAGKLGLLLVNLGTPDAADAPAVRRYLKEFLTDPRVIENQGALWSLILNGIILRIRPRRKARDYAKIWNHEKNESPLKTITRSQADKLAPALTALGPRLVVDWAMRYGNPSIASRLTELAAQGCERILVIPLYPQYCAATTATVGDEVFRVLTRLRYQPALRIAPPYYDDPVYIEALASSTRAALGELAFAPDVILASFHGVPQEYVDKGGPLLHALRRDHAAAARRARARRVEAHADVPVALRPRQVAGAGDRPDREEARQGRREEPRRRYARLSPPTASRRWRRSRSRTHTSSSGTAGRASRRSRASTTARPACR